MIKKKRSNLEKLHTKAFNNKTVCTITMCTFTNTKELTHSECSFGFNKKRQALKKNNKGTQMNSIHNVAT